MTDNFDVISRLYDEDGRERAAGVTTTTLVIPRDVILDEGWLVPAWYADEREAEEDREEVLYGDSDGTAARTPDPNPLIRRRPGRGMLEGFLKLADGDDDAILRYARRWGMLGLCGHGSPENHHIPPCTEAKPIAKLRCDHCAAAESGHPYERPPACSVRDYFEAEHVSHWRAYASGATEWLQHTRSVDQLNRLIRVSGTSFFVGGSPIELKFGGGGLLGELLVQVAHVLAGGDKRIIRCDGCGEWAESRQRGGGRRTYCAACRAAGVPNRVAARVYRMKNKANPNRVKERRGRGAAARLTA